MLKLNGTNGVRLLRARKAGATGLLIALTLSAVACGSAAAQDAMTPDSLSLTRAGAADGLAAAQARSFVAARWGTAAATFLLTPVLGGIGSLVAAQSVSGTPSVIPDRSPYADHPVYREAYVEAYREAFLPRYRSTVRRSVLFTTVAFFAGALILAG